MGTILASAIFTEADGILLDEDKVRWPDSEKLVYLNAGQRQAVIFKPDVYVVNDSYKLTAGTKQGLPDGSASYTNPTGTTLRQGIQLLRLVRNMGMYGKSAGPAIAVIGQDLMDALDPDWHAADADAQVLNYMFNPEDPLHYYVTPPQPPTFQGYVEAIYSAIPADVEASGGVYDVAITIPDIWRDILLDYILHRCYAKDAAISPYNAARAGEYWNQFVLGLERKDLVMRTWNPNVRRENPSTE